MPITEVCALASRIEPRDYTDTAAMLTRYTPAQLISLARRLDPGLEHRGSSLFSVPAWLEQMMSSQITAQSARVPRSRL